MRFVGWRLKGVIFGFTAIPADLLPYFLYSFTVTNILVDEKFSLSVSVQGCFVMSRFLAFRQALALVRTDRRCTIYRN